MPRPDEPHDVPEELLAELDRSWIELGRAFVRRRQPPAGSKVPDLSPVQMQALCQLADHPMRVGQLADRLGLADSTVTRLVDRFETLDLVIRASQPTDRRSVTVQLTLRGRRTAEMLARGRRAYLAGVLEPLEPAERAQLVRLIGKVVAVQDERERALERDDRRKGRTTA
jgi:DNA-binding MarR family transcriptional regulator